MRIAAEAVCGYFPMGLRTVDFFTNKLRVLNSEQTYVLDPCSGRGQMLAYACERLGIPTKNSYGCELDDGRAEEAAKVLGHVLFASFFDSRIVPIQSFSLAILNPPYSREIAQGDERGMQLESSFLQTAARYVTQDGVVILHCPDDHITDEVLRVAAGSLYDLHKVNLPQELRPYREALLVGKKREKVENYVYKPTVMVTDQMPAWDIPPGETIKTFEKTAPTNGEIEKALAASTLLNPFTQKRQVAKLRPVLPLGPGHLGLVLAAGFLDGYSAPPGYEPHVVRGIAGKDNKLVNEEITENEEGKETTTRVYRESIRLKIRAINAQGVIYDIR